MFLDGDEESSGVGGGELSGDSSLLAMVMSESSITESNKVAEKATVRTFSGTERPFQHREKTSINVDSSCVVPSIT